MRLYCIGAIKNAILAKKFFPGWICRFYYDKSVPEKIINKLKELDILKKEFPDEFAARPDRLESSDISGTQNISADTSEDLSERSDYDIDDVKDE